MTAYEVDPSDQTARDSAELAIAYGVTQAVLDNGQSGRDSAEAWVPIIGHVITVPLSAYLRSSLLALALAFPKSPKPDVAVPVKLATERSVKQIASWAAGASDRLLIAPTPVAPGVLLAPPAAPGSIGQRIGIGSAQVVRSTLTSAREQTRSDLATQLGAVYKVWRTRRDSRVRSTHGHLEGMVVPFEQQFTTLSGSTLRYPGDPDAPLSETAGCRCRLSYRLALADAGPVNSGPSA